MSRMPPKVPAGYVVVGDRVRCDDGRWRKIVSKTRPSDAMVRLVLDDGVVWEVRKAEYLEVTAL